MSVQHGPGLRSFLDSYRINHGEDILEIESEMSVEYDITSFHVLKNRMNRILMFNSLSGYPNFRLLTNVLGHKERILYATGTEDIEEFNSRFSRALNSGMRRESSMKHGSAAFMQNVLRDSEVDLYKLPIPSHYPSDGSRAGITGYITSGIVATRELDNPEIINLSFTRIQPISSNRYAFDAGSHGHLWNHLNRSVRSGKDAELTVLIGAHPIFYLLAASFVDDEYSKAAEFLDFELAKGLTNDIYIPSETEIVLEARFEPGKSFEEGPFAEYTGYMGQDSTKYTAEVKAVLMRDRPIYYDIQPSNSSEHVNTFSLPRSSRVSSAIRQFLPQGIDFGLTWPHSGARFLSMGWVEPSEKNYAMQLGISVMSLDPLWGKIVFINRGKVELEFLPSLARLLNTEEKMGDCVSVFRDMFVISSDFTAEPEGNVGKALFITDSLDGTYTTEVRNDELFIHSRYGTAVVSHRRRSDFKINIAVGDDIDLVNFDHVLWALATRVNPAQDFHITENSLSIYADRKTPEVPTLEPDSVRRIAKMFPD